LKKAVAIRERIEELEKDLTGILVFPSQSRWVGYGGVTAKMSAAARAKISAAAKARWAKIRAGKK